MSLIYMPEQKVTIEDAYHELKAWVVKRTDTFMDSLKAIHKNKIAIAQLDNKIRQLQE